MKPYTAAAVCGALGAIALIVSWTAGGTVRAVAGIAAGVLCCTGIGLAVFAYRRQLDDVSS